MIEGFADLSEFHEYEEYCQLVNAVFPEEKHKRQTDFANIVKCL